MIFKLGDAVRITASIEDRKEKNNYNGTLPKGHVGKITSADPADFEVDNEDWYIHPKHLELISNVSKYDRTIKGKYGSGECVVDVYSVLKAFKGEYSPEVDHAIKKLLCAGSRGAKNRKQDLQEAMQSIQRELDSLGE